MNWTRPPVSEATKMVAAQVLDDDAAIGFAGSQSNFELNVLMLAAVHNFLHLVRLPNDA